MNYEQGKEISGEIVYIFIYDAVFMPCHSCVTKNYRKFYLY